MSVRGTINLVAPVGPEGMRRFLADTAETFDLFKVTYPEVRDLGDVQLALEAAGLRGGG